MSHPLEAFRRVLARTSAEALGLTLDEPALGALVRTPEAGRGDFAVACFDLARRAKTTPPAAAEAVARQVATDARFERVEAVGPYVNVRIAGALLAGAVVAAARAPDYGSSNRGAGKRVVLDFSSPNIAKPLAYHHIRSTVIGAALARIHAAEGWGVAALNYLGDWGKQFGLLATGFRRFGDRARRADAKHLVEVYVRANREADVEARKAAIAAPAAAREARAERQSAASALAAATDPLEKKKLDARLRALDKKSPPGDFDAHLDALEARAATARAELPEAEAHDREARLWLRRMEDGDPDALAEWREFREASVDEFRRVYARMGVEFSSIEGESNYTPRLDATIARVAENPGVRTSEGALVVDLPYAAGEPPVLLKTKDGTTLYMTRDIAAAIDRFERFGFERSLYVIAQDQALHVAQLKRTLAAMGFAWADKMTHVSFGRVHGMSTRLGKVVFLDEVLDDAVAKAREVCAQSDAIDRGRIDETAESVGVGAVVFGDLKNLRTSDYNFKLEEAINFVGLTGPYVQYTHARLASILRKGGGAPEQADRARLALDEERAVLLAIGRYPEAVAQACDDLEPSVVTRAVLDVAQAVSAWLTSGNNDHGKRVLVDDAGLRAARLELVDASRRVLAAGLGLLGVRAPDAM